MERTYINEVQKEIGSTVKVQGFIENLRNSKYMAFIVLKDITGKLQITVEKEDHPELVDTIDKLTPDSVITVTGKVMENDYVKMGPQHYARLHPDRRLKALRRVSYTHPSRHGKPVTFCNGSGNGPVVGLDPVQPGRQIPDNRARHPGVIGRIPVFERAHRDFHLHAVGAVHGLDNPHHRIRGGKQQLRDIHRHQLFGKTVRLRPLVEHGIDTHFRPDSHRGSSPAVSPSEEQRPGDERG